MGERLGLAADDRAEHLAGPVAAPRLRDLESLDAVADRADRVAQLVPEHGEELVLGAAGGLGGLARAPLRLVELGVVDRHRRVGRYAGNDALLAFGEGSRRPP